jgi:hypothetical protein
MASTPVSHEATAPPAEPTTAPTETVEARFRRLEEAWVREVGISSSGTVLTNHWAFQEMIRMGEAVVPLMLRDLEREPQLWVWALPKITGVNPVPPSDAGNITKMSEAWVEWGRTHGYQW